MAQIYNSDLTKNMVTATKAAVSRDIMPTQLAEKVVPVINVNPAHNRIITMVKRATCTNSTSTTIFTTSAVNDTYIIGMQIAWIKDVTATALTANITAYINGLNTILCELRGFTLTVQNDSIFLSFPIPILIDRNTNVNLTCSTNVANVTAVGIVYGYEVNS